MTKVVVQDRGYWLRDEFWQEAADAGCEATLVEVRNGVLTTRAIRREEFAARFAGRIANWVKSEAKSVSVFRAALGPDERRRVTRLFRESVHVGLETVAREFTARTGAQGRVRLPAEASFVVVVHAEAKDGSPQLHAHVAVEDRVRVPGRERTYATHKRELYQLRTLFAAAASHHLAHRLHAEFGVRVEKTARGMTVLPDVPPALCRRASVRTRQIDAYIRAHAVTDTPLTRKYAAVVTRRENRDPGLGRRAFRADLARTGFRSEQICQRASRDQFVDVNRPSVTNEIRRVGREAKRLAKSRQTVTRIDLLTKALETAPPHHPVSRVKLATDAVLRSPNRVGLRPSENAHGHPVYVSRQTARQWKKVVRKIEVVLQADQSRPNGQRGPKRTEQAEQRKAKPDGATASQHTRTASQPNTDRRSERSTDLRAVVETALKSYRVIGAVGRVGVEAAKIAVELYQTWAKPVWRVRGDGNRNTPGSVARMVRDLKPLPRLDAHTAAIAAMLRLNGTLDQRLRYGEAVYRRARTPKFRVPRKSLVVIREASRAAPNDVAFLLRKAERARAKTLFVEQDHSRSALLQAAQSMRPGDHRPFPAPEMKR